LSASESDITPEKANDGFEAGDFEVCHIDSYCSNTGQGGYETLCAEEAALAQVKVIHPEIDSIVMCSDQGSGYKSTQTILGLRNSQSWGGPRVKHLHYNGPSEGKRKYTDGHMTENKGHRKNAMMAGCPPQCTTPAEEVLAQEYLGGYPGVHPFVLEFEYDEEMKLKKWDGISQYHDFQLNEDGSVTVWKSYKIGPGKTFSKEELDSLYESVGKQMDTDDSSGAASFPQTSTGAKYVHIDDVSDDRTASRVKIEKSRQRRKRELETKENIKAEKEQQKHEADSCIVRLFNVRNKIECTKCGRRFPNEAGLSKHQCVILTSQTVDEPSADTILGPESAPYAPEDENCEFLKKVEMGHGLTESRDQRPLDAVTKVILERLYQAGVERSSQRKGILEMGEAL